MSVTWVLDLANHQGNLDLARAANEGYSAVLCKATEGTTFKNCLFAGNHPFLMHSRAWWLGPRGWPGSQLTPYLWHSRYVTGSDLGSQLYAQDANRTDVSTGRSARGDALWMSTDGVSIVLPAARNSTPNSDAVMHVDAPPRGLGRIASGRTGLFGPTASRRPRQVDTRHVAWIVVALLMLAGTAAGMGTGAFSPHGLTAAAAVSAVVILSITWPGIRHDRRLDAIAAGRREVLERITILGTQIELIGRERYITGYLEAAANRPPVYPDTATGG